MKPTPLADTAADPEPPRPHPRRHDHDPRDEVPPILPLFAAAAWALGLADPASAQQPVEVRHKTVKVGDLDIFYREAGPKDAPTILLLHGFPTSSQMFRNLIPALGGQVPRRRPRLPRLRP